jgi:formylglycine-generating enzyme required for sulfatase activity
MAAEPVELVEIPAGWFRMGWDDGLPDARPAHRVWVDDFAISRTPVTNAEFGGFLRARGASAPPFWTDVRFADPGQPVVGVAWGEAVQFCEWLTAETGRPHRLPTEAEWERAARGGQEGARYPWGDDPPARWFGEPGGPLAAPPLVGQGPINGFGLTDLAGVVHEWCLDWYAADAYEPDPARAPTGPSHGSRRVSRGGAWRHQVPWSPVAHRSSLPPHLRYSDYGFRVVRGTPARPAGPEPARKRHLDSKDTAATILDSCGSR